MTGPISPKEASRSHLTNIPEAVFDVFNKLLSERCSAFETTVVITQPEVVDALETAGLKRSEIFEKRWLDIEAMYRKAGWDVTYDKPGYCESYDPIWTFSKTKKEG